MYICVYLGVYVCMFMHMRMHIYIIFISNQLGTCHASLPMYGANSTRHFAAPCYGIQMAPRVHRTTPCTMMHVKLCH